MAQASARSIRLSTAMRSGRVVHAKRHLGEPRPPKSVLACLVLHLRRLLGKFSHNARPRNLAQLARVLLERAACERVVGVALVRLAVRAHTHLLCRRSMEGRPADLDGLLVGDLGIAGRIALFDSLAVKGLGQPLMLNPCCD